MRHKLNGEVFNLSEIKRLIELMERKIGRNFNRELDNMRDIIINLEIKIKNLEK